MSDVSVRVPARPDFVHVLRSVIASVAARADLSIDDIEDLRLAVDEACAHLLAIRGFPTTLTMRVAVLADGGIEVATSVDIDDATWPPGGAERSLAWQVLSALADEARFELVDGRPVVRLIKRRVPAGTR
jgi:serine/threonine-protein kinase RsbW